MDVGIFLFKKELLIHLALKKNTVTVDKSNFFYVEAKTSIK